MKTLIYGAGPIGQWLALRLGKAGNDVKLLARGDKLQQMLKQGMPAAGTHRLGEHFRESEAAS